jgi:ABC-type multidrug transport system fused ATPase/permease subunit
MLLIVLVLLGMRSKSSSMQPTLSSTLDFLEPRDKMKLLAAWVFRIISNFLDIAALGGIALLATAVANLGRTDKGTRSAIPFLGDLAIDANSAVGIALLVAILFFVKSLFSAWFSYWAGTHITRVETKLAKRMLESYFEPVTSISATYNLASMQNTLVNSLYSLISIQLLAAITASAEATLLILLVVGFAVVNPVATLTLILYLTVFLLVMNRTVTRRLQAEARKAYDSAEQTQQSLRNLYNVRVETSLIGRNEEWLSLILLARQSYGVSAVKMQFFSGLPRYVVESALVFGLFAFIGVLVVFSDLPSQAVTVGVFLTGGLRLVASILPLQAAVHSYKQAVTSGESAFITLKRNSTKQELNPKEVQFVSGAGGLGFAIYDPKPERGQTTRELKAEVLRVLPGDKVAIVGPSGSGKTTLINEVLTEFLRQVSTRGSDAQIFGQVSLVPQRPELIKGTLRQNVTLSPSHTSDSGRLFAALNLAGLATLIEHLELGVETLLDPETPFLSGGEIQRLGLARAIFQQPKLLFLDESTSALDAATESQVMANLDSLKGEMTIVVIAHRLSTVRNADKIVYIEDRKVVGTGSYETLLQTVPGFKEAVLLLSTDVPGK